MTTTPRVFVMYAHDSADHRAAVLDFCTFLTAHGIDVRVDRWAEERRRDWYLWATSQILTADYVAVIASPACRDVGDGRGHPSAHRGLQSEMRLLRELYHQDPQYWIPKVLPVILPGRDPSQLPTFLQPQTADHFTVAGRPPKVADELLRILYGRPEHVRPPLGAGGPWRCPARGRRGPHSLRARFRD